MKIKPLSAKLCVIFASALTLLGTILRTIAMFTCYDGEIGYFDRSPLSLLMTLLFFAAVLIPIVLALITPKSTLPTVWSEPGRNFAPIFPLALFITAGLWSLYLYFSGLSTVKMILVAGILALVSGVYYLLLIFNRTSVPTLCAIGYAPVFWALVALAETYSDQLTTMNSPIKLGLQFGFLGIMLMTAAELRFRLGKAAPRSALCFHCIALFLSFVGSIPTLIALASGILSRPIHGTYALVLLGGGIYAAFRLAYFVFIQAPDTVDTTDPSNESNPPENESEQITDEGGSP